MTNAPECAGIGRETAFLGKNQRCEVCGALVDGVPGDDKPVLGYHLDRRHYTDAEKIPHHLTARGFFEAQERSNAARRELGLD